MSQNSGVDCPSSNLPTGPTLYWSDRIPEKKVVVGIACDSGQADEDQHHGGKHERLGDRGN